MIQIRQILCPVDFSDSSRRALDHAAAVARWYEATLTVQYVHLNLPAPEFPTPPLSDEDRGRLQTDLERLCAHLPSGVKLDLLIEESFDVRRAIVERAAALQADLLVIGSHGRSGVERLVLGSVAEKVMRTAPCPVMVVPPRAPDADPDAPVQFRRMLCPVDFSEAADRALRYALSLAAESDALLTVLHVIEVPRELGEGLADWVNVGELWAAAEADRMRRLGEAIPADASTYCTIETVVRQGTAYREILKLAAEGPADLIVMGVHGRGAIDLLLFGSNTAQVVRAAACPVLIVPTR